LQLSGAIQLRYLDLSHPGEHLLRRAAKPITEKEVTADDEPQRDDAAPRPEPRAAVAHPSLRLALERALAKLTRHQRDVFLLYEVEGFVTRRFPRCWKSRKRPQRTRFSRRRKIFARCWNLLAAAISREHGESDECDLQRSRSNFRGGHRSGVGLARGSCGDVRVLCRRASLMEISQPRCYRTSRLPRIIPHFGLASIRLLFSTGPKRGTAPRLGLALTLRELLAFVANRGSDCIWFVLMVSGILDAATTRGSAASAGQPAEKQALVDVEHAESAYVQAIDKLAGEAKPQWKILRPRSSANYREKLMVLDSAIDDLRRAALARTRRIRTCVIVACDVSGKTAQHWRRFWRENDDGRRSYAARTGKFVAEQWRGVRGLLAPLLCWDLLCLRGGREPWTRAGHA